MILGSHVSVTLESSYEFTKSYLKAKSNKLLALLAWKIAFCRVFEYFVYSERLRMKMYCTVNCQRFQLAAFYDTCYQLLTFIETSNHENRQSFHQMPKNDICRPTYVHTVCMLGQNNLLSINNLLFWRTCCSQTIVIKSPQNLI